MSSPQSFLVGLNFSYQGKSGHGDLSGSEAWQNKRVSIGELINHAVRDNGYPYMGGILEPRSRRKAANITGGQVFFLDFDHGEPFDEFRQDRAFWNYAIAAWESASSQPRFQKYRTVYATHRWCSPAEYQAIIKYLIHLNPAADTQCSDISRFFFGAPGREPLYQIPDDELEEQLLDEAFIQTAIGWYEAEQARALEHSAQAREQLQQAIAEHGEASLIALVQDALSHVPARQAKGEGSYEMHFAIASGLLNSFGAEIAIGLINEYCPANSQADWYPDRLIKSLIANPSSTGRTFSLRTIFKHARNCGWIPDWSNRVYRSIYSQQAVSNQPTEQGSDEAFAQWAKRRRDQERQFWEHHSLQFDTNLNNPKQSATALRKKLETRTVNQRYLSLDPSDVLQQGTVYAVKSALGTGKTEQLARILAASDRGVLGIGYRNSLLLQMVHRLESSGWACYHLHHDNAHGLIRDPHSRVFFCFDSLVNRQVRPQDCDGKILILDEAVSSIKHLLTSKTIGKQRAEVLANFEECLKRAFCVIVLDGNLNDFTINYLLQIKGGNDTRLVKHLNEWQNNEVVVEIVAALAESGEIWNGYYRHLLSNLLESLELYKQAPGRRAHAVVADSQKMLEALDRKLSELGYRVLRIDSLTITDPAVKKIVANISEEARNYDVVLLSPTAESGISIDTRNHFVRGFGCFFGVIDSASQMQMLRRVRDCQRWSVAVPEYTRVEDNQEGARATLPRQLSRQITEYIEQDAIAALSGTDTGEATLKKIAALFNEQRNSPHFKATVELQAARNYEKQHTRECLQRRLEHAGYTVTFCQVRADSKADIGLQAEREAIEVERSNAIYRAEPFPTLDEALRVKTSFSCSIEDRWRAEATILRHKLPGITQSPEWKPELVRRLLFSDRNLLKRLERWVLLHDLKIAKALATNRYEQAAENGSYLLDLKSDYALLKIIDELGLLEILESTHDNSSSKLNNICDQVNRSKRKRTALNRGVGKQNPVQFVSKLASLVGIESESGWKPGAERGTEAGDRIYQYHSPERDSLNHVLIECITERLKNWQQKQIDKSLAQQAVQPAHLPSREYTSIASGEQNQSQSQQAVEPINHPPSHCPPQKWVEYQGWWYELLAVKGPIAVLDDQGVQIKVALEQINAA